LYGLFQISKVVTYGRLINKSSVSGATVVVLGSLQPWDWSGDFPAAPKGVGNRDPGGGGGPDRVVAPCVLLLLKWIAARKAKPFSNTLRQAAGSTPNSISTAANRAKLDDLRRNFDAGVAKFNAAGKDLYQLPWYLLIGESGSGKTKRSAIPASRFRPASRTSFKAPAAR